VDCVSAIPPRLSAQHKSTSTIKVVHDTPPCTAPRIGSVGPNKPSRTKSVFESHFQSDRLATEIGLSNKYAGRINRTAEQTDLLSRLGEFYIQDTVLHASIFYYLFFPVDFTTKFEGTVLNWYRKQRRLRYMHKITRLSKQATLHDR
jgi:hypothetical protein